MEKGDIVFARIPFMYRGQNWWKYREVKITGIAGNNNFNCVPTSPNHKFAHAFKREELTDSEEIAKHQNAWVEFLIQGTIKKDQTLKELKEDFVYRSKTEEKELF